MNLAHLTPTKQPPVQRRHTATRLDGPSPDDLSDMTSVPDCARVRDFKPPDGQPAEIGDQELAAAFCSDVPAEVDRAVAYLQPRLTTLIHRLAGWSADAEDLVQDVFIAALSAKEKFRGESRFETWLTRIAINQCRAYHRRRWLRNKLFAGWLERQSRDESPAADAALTAEERNAAVRRAVAQLPTKLREAIVLCYLQEISIAEAAEALDIRRGTLEVRLTRARRKLAELLEP